MSTSEIHSGLPQRLRGHARKVLRKSALLRRLLQGLIIVCTLAAGVISAVKEGYSPQDKAVAGAFQTSALAVVALCSVMLLIADDTTAEIVQDADEARDIGEGRLAEIGVLNGQIEILAKHLETSETLVLMSTAMMASVGEALQQRPALEDRKRLLIRFLDILVANKSIVFGIGDEQWNFAIYQYDQSRQVLICEACRRPSREDEERPHREWPAGEGHVGSAFKNSQAVIVSDSTDAKVKALIMLPTHQQRDHDVRNYRAAAAVPIRLSQTDPPIGVVVATSDQVGRFDDYPAEGPPALVALARTLATLMSAYTLQDQIENGRRKDV